MTLLNAMILAASLTSASSPEALFRELEEQVLGAATLRMRYTITAEGRVRDLTGEGEGASGGATLRMHRDSGLPARREQTVELPTGTMRVDEQYEFLPTKTPVSARVAVFPIALNDLSNQPASPELADRMQALATALRERLATACGYQVVPADSLAPAPAETSPGYLYAHPEVAVGLAASAHAEWIVIPRLNRASPWVTDLQAHVVRTRDTTLVSNRIVEVKGIELTPELAAKLVQRGAAWMADQVSQAIDHTSGASGSAARRCPA